MVVRRKKKPATKKTAKKRTAKKRVPRKTGKTSKRTVRKTRKSPKARMKSHWETFYLLQEQVDKAWKKLKNDVENKAPADTLIQDKNQLLLLLGECNYMARQCMMSVGRETK